MRKTAYCKISICNSFGRFNLAYCVSKLAHTYISNELYDIAYSSVLV